MMFFKRKEKISELPDTPQSVPACLDEYEQEQSHVKDGFEVVIESLKSQQKGLLRLVSTTEDEFLGIGSRLQDFYARTALISTASLSVTEMVGGEEIKSGIRELVEITDKIRYLLKHLKVEAEQSSISLKETLLMIGKVDEPMAGFKKIMKILHVLGTSTKIESARLGELGTSFQNVADDVENLAVQINDKSVRILIENISLSDKIKQTLNRMSEIDTVKDEDVNLVMHQIRSHLDIISGVHRKCSETSEVIAASSSEVSAKIYEIVTSMQFHDITRQQLEHVLEALTDLESKITLSINQSDNSSGFCTIDNEIAGEVYGVCKLQSAQLLHARDLLTNAVSGIVDKLTGIASSERAIAEQTRSIIATSDGADDSLLVEIEKSLQPVIELLAESASANRNLADAVSSVAETVSQISTFVNDIEMIGEDIKLIALNSQIKAALAGKEGSALGVLAEAIQRLSIDACVQTAAVTDTLNQITRATDALLNGVSADTSRDDTDIELMAYRLKTLIESIRTINDNVVSTLARTDTSVHELSNDIDSATFGITVHNEVAREIECITAELGQITERIREYAPDLTEVDLEALSGRYTMNSERKIHAAITGTSLALFGDSSEPDVQFDSDTSAMEDNSELGDNVELF